MEYRKDIQGLRAIAVLFVFIFHLNSSWLPGGFVGVDIFFVISGFLISSIILNKTEKNEFSILNFYKSRIKRIVPAYYFLLLVIVLVAIFIYIGIDIKLLRRTFFWSAIFNSNNFLAGLDTYFGASSSENPFLHTWTLAIEMQFYLFLPILLLFIRKKWLLPTISILTIVLFAYGTVEILNNNKNEMYFSLLTRTPEFLMGVLASIISRKGIVLNNKLNSFLGLSSVLLLLSSAVFINANSLFPGALAVVPCLGAATLILFPNKATNIILSSKPMVYIGELSYSLYLWHWPIMAFFRYYYSTIDFSAQQMFIIVFLTIALSLFSFYCIEKPLRKISYNVFLKRFSLLIVLNIIAGVIMVPLCTSVTQIPYKYIMPSLGLNSHGSNTGFKEVEVFGDPLSKNNRNLLVGDSHGLCMKPFFNYLGKNNSFAIKTITNDGIAPIPGVTENYFTENSLYKRYKGIVDYSKEEIEKSTVIFLMLARSGSKLEDPLIKLINSIKDDQYIVLMSDFPILDSNPVRINRDFIKKPSLTKTYAKEYTAPSSRIMNAINSKKNAFFLDLSESKVFDLAPFYNDTLMYYDKGHLNAYGAEKYAIESESKFMELFNKIYPSN